MRAILLVLALVLVFAIAVSADEPGQVAPAFSLTAPSAAQTRHFELSSPGAKGQFRLIDPRKLNAEADKVFIVGIAKRTLLRLDRTFSDHTCYRMRAYKVRRIDNSDSTEPAGYSTCLSANRVQMKSAVGNR